MKVSEKLSNIKEEILDIDEMAQEELGTDIVYVIETGKEDEEHEKKIKEFMQEQEGHYDHRPRRYISIWPNIAPITSLLLNHRNRGITYGKTRFSSVIDDMLQEIGNEFIQTTHHEDLFHLSGDEPNIYSTVLLELDTNYVNRLSSLKASGGNIKKKLKRDVLSAIQDIHSKYPQVAKRITDNIMAKLHNMDELFNKYKYEHSPLGVGENRTTLKLDTRKMIHEEKFLMLLDITLAWYINHKIVQQKVLDHDIFDILDQFYFDRTYFRDFRILPVYKRLVEADIEDGEKLINILLRRIELEFFDSSPFEAKELKYTPIFVKKEREEGESYLKCNKDNISKSSLYQESASGLIEYGTDTESFINFMSECVITGNEHLISESLMDIFRKSDTQRLTDVAREVDQAKVEFEFMTDRYSKSDAMHNAYDVLEKIDKAIDKARRRDTREALENLRNELLHTIKKAREKDIKKERMNISINYPEGYEG